jgi:nitrate reductase assembly molybdenum cofactor insertion protein NarJ
MKSLNHYAIWADVFRYPEQDLSTAFTKAFNLVAAAIPEKVNDLTIVLEKVRQMTVLQQREYYMKTFDVQAVCYLDIGYVLFGEDYKRAQLLVNLQQEHKAAGVDCGLELGDHLPNILCLLSMTSNADLAEELGYIITVPAIRFMLKKFNNIENYYKELLEALLLFLQRDFRGIGLAEYAVPEHVFAGDHEFVMTSPKQQICDTLCNKRKSI